MMDCQTKKLIALALAALLPLAGCHPGRTFYFHEETDMAHYRAYATEIEYPDATEPATDSTLPPPTLRKYEDYEPWGMSLQEALQIALANNEVVRTLTGGSPDTSLSNPDRTSTIYDPALQQTNPGGGFGIGAGAEAALSAFDANLSASMLWSRNEQPRNVGGVIGNAVFARDFQQDQGVFQTQLAKTAASGTQMALRNNTIYEWNNNPTRDIPSDWTTTVEAEVRQPFLQGAGTTFNRIAGPGSIVGVYRGVLIARINNDLTLADFEGQVLNMVLQIETSYWDLYNAYRTFDAARRGRDAVLDSWRRVRSLQMAGARGGGGLEEARARQEYFVFRAAVEDSLCILYERENRLRYLLGLPPTDGRLLRPTDEPTTVRLEFDWPQIHAEALVRQVNLRRQRWQIKRSELELIAARNFLLPRLDGVARYRWFGLGDDFIDPNGVGISPDAPSIAGTDAVATLTDGSYQSWDLGLQLNVPIGFRRELSAVRHSQLLLARDRAVLRDQELEVAHLLTDAIRVLDCRYTVAETNFNRVISARREVDAAQAVFDVGAELATGPSALDMLLDAQRRLSEAERDYFASLVEYNKAIALVHFRKGSLLEYDNVYLAEGPWPAKAYFDAKQLARQRDAGHYFNYGLTRPHVISRGPYPQHMGTTIGGDFGPIESVPSEGAMPLPPPADQNEAPPQRLPPVE